VEGQVFSRWQSVAGSVLLLNGAGVRAVAWFKGYVAALYLPERAGTAEQAHSLPPPKRLQLRMLQEVPATELAKAVRKGVSRNGPKRLSPAQQEQLDQQLQRVESHIRAVGTVRKGDVLDIDQDPSGALRISVNGTLRGETAQAAALYGALLLAFVGPQPYDERLRAGLLGRSP
jgi:flagellar motor switch/type III secretory pathway protein FliN